MAEVGIKTEIRMIKLDFFNFLAGYSVFMILVLMGSWIFSRNVKEERGAAKNEFLRQCHICTYIFFESQGESVCICPRCKSYLKKEEVK